MRAAQPRETAAADRDQQLRRTKGMPRMHANGYCTTHCRRSFEEVTARHVLEILHSCPLRAHISDLIERYACRRRLGTSGCRLA